MKDDDAVGRPDLEALPAAYASWRETVLGRNTDELEQNLILKRIGPLAGLSILDVGCGDGILTLALARQGAQATGVDTSERMVAAARERIKQHGVDASFKVAKHHRRIHHRGRRVSRTCSHKAPVELPPGPSSRGRRMYICHQALQFVGITMITILYARDHMVLPK